MPTAKQGDTVKVEYTGKLADGTVFDSSAQRGPLEFAIGQQAVLPGLEEAVVGMDVGETKQTKISADKAFGPRRDELVLVVERERLPEQLEPSVGQRLNMQQSDGQSIPAWIVDVAEATITLDANHPLAGQDLDLDLKLIEIC